MAGTEEMETLFRDRFQGHESPVDPGLWDGIAQQLPQALPADDGEGLREMLRDRFQGHEAAVDPSAWSAISGQLGHAVGAGAGGGVLSGASGWLVGGAAATLLAGGLYLALGPAGTDDAVAPLVELHAATQEEPTGARPMEAEPTPAVEEIAAVPTERAAEQVTPTTGPATATTHPTLAEAEVVADAGPEGADTGAETVTPDVADEKQDAPQEATDAPTPEEATAQAARPDPPGIAVVDAIISEMAERVTEQPEVLKHGPRVAEATVARSSDAEEDAPAPDAWPDEPEEEKESITLFMPNVFTPDGDGLNDNYMIEGHGFEHVTIKIFSAQNNRIVFSADRLLPWDGTDMNGEPCPDGYYMVAVEARGMDGRTIPQGKVVWLNRNTAR